MLSESLDEYVLKREETREWDGKWHASALFSCDRQATYGKIGVPESDPKDARTSRTFFLGHLLHRVVQEAFEEYLAAHDGGKVYAEVPLQMPDLDYKSTADALFHLPDDRWVIVEIKTQKGSSFHRKDLLSSAHEMQGRSYGMALRRYGCPELGIPPLGDKLDTLVVMYVSKDNLDTRLFEMPIDPTIEEDIANRIQSLTVLAKHGLVPPRLPRGSKGLRAWQCDYCRFATRCWTVDPEEGEVTR